MPTVTISLSESLKQFLAHEVATKGYGNVSEYVRGLLRQAQVRDTDARLEALQLEGLASGHDLPLTPQFWRKLKVEAGQILNEHILEQHKKNGKRQTAQ
jgi:antitoxin ParD1/3/4